MVLALSLQVTDFSLTDNNKRNAKQKIRQKQHCVGRESNPGQLLGRQLCSPLYNRRVDWLSFWQFCFHRSLCVCLRIIANGVNMTGIQNLYRNYQLKNGHHVFFHLRNLLFLTFNIIGHRRTWINVEWKPLISWNVRNLISCRHKFSLIFNNCLSWTWKVAFV